MLSLHRTSQSVGGLALRSVALWSDRNNAGTFFWTTFAHTDRVVYAKNTPNRAKIRTSDWTPSVSQFLKQVWFSSQQCFVYIFQDDLSDI